jgi:NTE family protein
MHHADTTSLAFVTPADKTNAAPDAEGGLLRRHWRAWRGAPARLNLALQGGGAHGAFTWGVLDALLADERTTFDGLSGSSAGAINAVLLADGWVKGGREGARAALARFWTELGEQLPQGLLAQGEGEDMGLSPSTRLLVHWARHFSPSQLNPLDLNPLRDLLKRQIDFAGLRAHSPFKLFVGTTQVHTGQLRLFREHEIDLDRLMASACLPKIHHPVVIDGQPYWDGGYAANPAVFPLFYDCEASDVLLVLLSPLVREGTPQSVEEIDARIAELAFSAHFMREMRMFAQAIAQLRPGWWQLGRLERRLRKLRFHMVDSGGVPSLHRTDTKLLAHAPFLDMLKGHGRERAQAWLDAHFSGVGQRSTIDLQRCFD